MRHQYFSKLKKITGALEFLDSLSAIAKEVKAIRPHIDRLLEINFTLYPEIQDAIAKINEKIEGQNKVKNNLDSEIAILIEKLMPFEDEIRELRSVSTEENPFNPSNYELSHPEYKCLKSEKSELQSQLYKVNRLISDLNSFLTILNRSINKLDELKQANQAA